MDPSEVALIRKQLAGCRQRIYGKDVPYTHIVLREVPILLELTERLLDSVDPRLSEAEDDGAVVDRSVVAP